MLDRSTRSDAATEQEVRAPDQLADAPDNLRGRLEQLADGHPSSPEYRAGDNNRGRGRPDKAADAADSQRQAQPSDRHDPPEHHGIGWEAPHARDHAGRPADSDITGPADRSRHILDGDGPGKPGGGHRHGAAKPNKTEFPASWSDEAILAVVEDVARQPDVVEWQSNRTWRATGDRDNVRVTAVLRPDGTIWTAWPHPGGAGVTKNPEA